MASDHIQALEMTAQGDWHGAHELIQEVNDELGCLIHGYLHREEGDFNNANYWYSQVGQPVPDNSLEEEYERLYQLADNPEQNW